MTEFVAGFDRDKPTHFHLVAVFDKNDDYRLKGKTHGLTSHAIKHYGEFDVGTVKGFVDKAINIAKQSPELYIINHKGEVIADGDKAKVMLQYKVMLNTFDLINDKIINGEKLNDTEQKIYDVIQKMKVGYLSKIKTLTSKAVDVNDVNKKSLENLIKRGAAITFMGRRQGKINRFYYDPKTTAYITASPDGKKVITMFQTNKKFVDTLKDREIYVTDNNLRQVLFRENKQLKEKVDVKTLKRDLAKLKALPLASIVATLATLKPNQIQFLQSVVNTIVRGVVENKNEVITEMPHVSYGTGDYEYVDFQIEKMGIPEEQKRTLIKSFHFGDGFYGKSKKTKKWLHFKPESVKLEKPKAGAVLLPEDWWKYATIKRRK